MGWDTLIGAGRKESVQDFRDRLTRNGYKVLKDKAGPGSQAQFFAVEKEEKSFVITLLTERDGKEWRLKDLSESCGPCETRCPKELLDMTKGEDHKNAVAWRKEAYEYNQKKKQTFEEGDVVSIFNGEKQYLIQGPYKKGSYLIQDNKGKIWKGITAELTLVKTAKERYS